MAFASGDVLCWFLSLLPLALVYYIWSHTHSRFSTSVRLAHAGEMIRQSLVPLFSPGLCQDHLVLTSDEHMP